MTGNTRARQYRCAAFFFTSLDACVQRLATDARHVTCFRQTILGIYRRELLIHHVVDAKFHTAFFAGLREQNHITVERDAAALKQQYRHQ